jgi:hypothetical protein
MRAFGEIAKRMVAAGIPIEEVGELIAAATLELGATTRSTGAIRQERYRRNKASQSVTERNGSYERNDRNKASQSVTSDAPLRPALSIEEYKIKKDRERGTRIPPDWEPSSEDIESAREAGLPEDVITREAQKFRNYWTAKTGASAIKTAERGWPATWRNWVLKVSEDRGFVRAPPKFTPEELEKGREWYARKKREQES